MRNDFRRLFRSAAVATLGLAAAFGALSGTSVAEAANLISNPSLEQPGTGGPVDWVKGRWGTNTALFDYPVAGASGNAARVRMTAYTSGDAKWAPKPVSVTGGAEYKFSEKYLSDVGTFVTLQIAHSDGRTTYMDLGALPAAGSWTAWERTFTVPSTASSVSVFHVIKQIGELSVDDFFLDKTADAPPPPPPPPPSDPENLVRNPSFESSASGLPTDWIRGRWGTNTVSFDYPVSGAAGVAARIRMTSRTSGDAKWAFRDVSVTPGRTYDFSNQSMSDVPTFVTVQFRNSAGATSYKDLGSVPASGSWRTNSFSFAAPAGAVSATVFHVIRSVGTLTVDNYSLKDAGATTPLPAPKGIVTLSFDDGTKSIYQNAMPILNGAGLKSTQYIVTGRFTYPGYVNEQEVLAMQAAGHEIGSHTVTHRDLTTLSASELQHELNQSRSTLLSIGVNSVTTLAYPFGAYNQTVLQAVANAGYKAARSTDDGNNLKGQLNTYALKRKPVNVNHSAATVNAWIDDAVAKGEWLILALHRVDTSGTTYSTTPATLQAIVDHLVANGVKVVTLSEGYEMMK